MNRKRLLSYVRQALDDYTMIDDNDRIAVGVSGGKDSMTLLYSLKELQRFYPKKFDIAAITVHLGFEGYAPEAIQGFCEDLHGHMNRFIHKLQIFSSSKRKKIKCVHYALN